MYKSKLSLFGKVTSIIHDEYPIYIFEIPSELINNYLPDKLLPFPVNTLKSLVKQEVLYSKPVLYSSRLQISHEFEELPNKTTFEDLFEEILSETDHINRYNFVITGNYIIFVRIAHIYHISYYLLGKHIILSNDPNDVRFAGELWCSEKKVFLLNNSSGTYKPAKNLIENTVQLFNELTPRLHFQGIDFHMNHRPSLKHRLMFKIKNKIL